MSAFASKKTIAIAFIAAGLFWPGSGRCGGLIGDLINNVAPGAGTQLDDAHRRLKEAIPPYKSIEEGASRAVNETFVQAVAPALQDLIARSRDDAIRNGVQTIPPTIRQNLEGFIPNNILDIVRFRVKGGGDLTLQVNAIRYGEASAITLDYVIVFANGNDAQYNPTLWAHELTHVQQYQSWGLRDFSIRYLRSYGDVEKPAYEAETRYMAWAALKNSRQFSSSTGAAPTSAIVNRPITSFTGVSLSNACGTAIATCSISAQAPVGTPCWCSFADRGFAAGALIPTGNYEPPPVSGFPSGFGMTVCGCWGPNPPALAFEPRCMSGRVRVAQCLGWCAPGHPLYGYVCL